jgi:hypothetical protein
MQLELRCGDVIPYTDGEPICPVHGRQVVARTIGMRPPRIRGVATGPHVDTCDLPAWTGRIVGSEPKES